METTFENTDGMRNGKRARSELGDTARAAKTAATDELKSFVSDVEDVVKRVADVSDEDVARVRAKIQSVINAARDGVTTSSEAIKRQAQYAARQTDEYVHESPWQAVGISAALGAVIGLSIGFLASRR
jgi:ElaB/YqjD/DUF883 family membrane-anchored ribosome-binding protein